MENKQTVFRKVSIKERTPKEPGFYMTNKGLIYYTDINNCFVKKSVYYWLEEVELPTQEEILEYARDEQGLEDYDIEQDVFVDGANYILNKLK